MSGGPKLALTVDLDEWFHSRRWVEGAAASAARQECRRRSAGRLANGSERSLVGPTFTLLDLFDRYDSRGTFFILGEVAERYPDLVTRIAERGHEVACHGFYHMDMTTLGPDRFAEQVAEAAATLQRLTGQRAAGFRAPNLIYEPWATAILEAQGFVYDSTVCPSRSISGKYRGWAHAPVRPYRPSYDAIEEPGSARLIELPLASFPGVNLPAGSGIAARIIGGWWTTLALEWRLRRASTVFYLHPWEVGPKPPRSGPWLRNAVFMRRTGDWMLRVLDGLLQRFSNRIVTAGQLARMYSGTEPARQGAQIPAAITIQTGEVVASPE